MSGKSLKNNAELLTLGSFVLALVTCIISGYSIIYALVFGLICFIIYSVVKGFDFHQINAMIWFGIFKLKNLFLIFVFIGLLTASWRLSGTIPYIIHRSINLINPALFYATVFLLCCLISTLIGTAIGTVSTIGIICMMIAQANQADLGLTAGAIIGGSYFGDRFSPMSSSANLICNLTDTNIYTNLRNMVRSTVVPFFASILIYLAFSLFRQSVFKTNVDVTEIGNHFALRPIVILPALIILVFSLLKVRVTVTMLFSIVSACLIAVLVQKAQIADILTSLLLGYEPHSDSNIVRLMGGGGLISMSRAFVIISISASYFGFFLKTDLIKAIDPVVQYHSNRYGNFATIVPVSLITAALSCNQTLSVMLTSKLIETRYASRHELAVDLEDSAIVIAPLIPWSVAATIPIIVLNAESSSLLYAFFLYLLPVMKLMANRARLRVTQSEVSP